MISPSLKTHRKSHYIFEKTMSSWRYVNCREAVVQLALTKNISSEKNQIVSCSIGCFTFLTGPLFWTNGFLGKFWKGLTYILLLYDWNQMSLIKPRFTVEIATHISRAKVLYHLWFLYQFLLELLDGFWFSEATRKFDMFFSLRHGFVGCSTLQVLFKLHWATVMFAAFSCPVSIIMMQFKIFLYSVDFIRHLALRTVKL